MTEQMPQSNVEKPLESLDVAQELEARLGPIPEQLEQLVRWASQEQLELSTRAEENTGEGVDRWKRVRGKIATRIIMTGLAMATVMPMMTSSAEAGERGRNWRRAGSIVSIVAGVGERVLEHKQDEHRRKARNLEYQFRMLEREASSLVHRIERTSDRLITLKARLAQETREHRKNTIQEDIDRLSMEKSFLIERVVEIDGQIRELGPELEQEIESAGKAGLFADIADIAREQADWARRGY